MSRNRRTIDGDLRGAAGRRGRACRSQRLSRGGAGRVSQVRAPDLFASMALHLVAADAVVDDHGVVVAANVHDLAAPDRDAAVVYEAPDAMTRQAGCRQDGIAEPVP